MDKVDKRFNKSMIKMNQVYFVNGMLMCCYNRMNSKFQMSIRKQ